MNLNINLSLEPGDVREPPFPPGPSPTDTTKEHVMLVRVASMVGRPTNSLVHELLVNPSYQIPVPPVVVASVHTSSSDGSGEDTTTEPVVTATEMSRLMQSDPEDAGRTLKRHMLNIMGDRMVSSMLLSPYQSPAEVTAK